MSNLSIKRSISRHLVSVLLIPILIISCSTSEPERDEIIAVAQKLFDTIANRDSEAARNLLLPDGTFSFIRAVEGQVNVGSVTHEQFIQGLLMEESSEFLERMWDPTVLIQGRIAILWTHYDFHIDGEFSHCGIDAFSFLKTNEGWKISGITYTVETEGCVESPLGPVSGANQ